MSAPQRIYTVNNKAASGATPRLVRAPNQAQVLRHVAADTLAVAVASQDDLVSLVAAGVKVENSGDAAQADGQA